MSWRLAAQVALDGEGLVDRVAQLGDLVFGQVADLVSRSMPSLGEQLPDGRTADAVDVRQSDFERLFSGRLTPEIRAI